MNSLMYFVMLSLNSKNNLHQYKHKYITTQLITFRMNVFLPFALGGFTTAYLFWNSNKPRVHIVNIKTYKDDWKNRNNDKTICEYFRDMDLSQKYLSQQIVKHIHSRLNAKNARPFYSNDVPQNIMKYMAENFNGQIYNIKPEYCNSLQALDEICRFFMKGKYVPCLLTYSIDIKNI